MKKLPVTKEKIDQVGDAMVDLFHYLALFVIGATIVWAAIFEYLSIMQEGHAALQDILLLFIYLELGAMVGIYFRTHKLPVQFLIYIAITALARHLVIDVLVADHFHLYLLLSTAAAIVILCFAARILASTARRYGRPEDDLLDKANDPSNTAETRG